MPATLAQVPPDIDGLDSEAWIARGDGLSIEDGLLEDAVLCYSNAICLAPLDVEARTSKGAALMRLGRYESAAENERGGEKKKRRERRFICSRLPAGI